MKIGCLRIIPIFFLIFLLAGCGSAPPATVAIIPSQTAIIPTVTATEVSSTPLASSTPDACSSGEIQASVQKVHRHMREFDDAAVLASNLPVGELTTSIKDLQRIRREAEDEQIPPCLIALKTYQIQHMNSVIDTLLAFIGGTDTAALEKGITIARQQHDQYTLELARLLGITIVPATVPVISTPLETATP